MEIDTNWNNVIIYNSEKIALSHKEQENEALLDEIYVVRGKWKSFC
jgi:hypothetical protein